jgi:hypothetical protein
MSVKLGKLVVTTTKQSLIMTTNNNSAAVNNNNNAEAAIMSTYTVKIADRSGHTEMAELTLDQAADNILGNAENNARWVFINGEKFEFEGANYRSETNMNNLKAKLEMQAKPEIVLTGVLIGGTKA